MKALAIQKANETMAEAAFNIDRIHLAKTFQQHKAGWSGFLMANRRFYKDLEAGCLRDPFDQDWLAIKIQERNDDPLLNYLRHARNAAEYGLAPLFEAEDGIAIYEGNFILDGKPVTSAILPIGKSAPWICIPPNETVKFRDIRPCIARLQTIVSGGKRYPPPTSHLGEMIELPMPKVAAVLGFRYLERLLPEAEARIV